MKNLAIIFGGDSVEHDISVITGVQLLNSVSSQKYKIIPLYIKKQIWYTGKKLFDISTYADFSSKGLKRVELCSGGVRKAGLSNSVLKIDVAIIASHGGSGENGELQGLLKMYGIPFASSGTEGSAVTMNKLYSTVLAESLFIDVPAYMSISAYQHKYDKGLIGRVFKKVGQTVILKPMHLGSSIAINVAKTAEELEKSLQLAFMYDNSALAMEYLDVDYELNIALMEIKGEFYFSQIEKPEKQGRILTFSDKYEGAEKGMVNLKRELPAVIPTEQATRVRQWAKKLYREMNLAGIVRIDFLVSRGYVYFNEVNSIPGSLGLYLFSDKSPEEILDMLIEDALLRAEKNAKIITGFSSSVLDNANLCGVKK